MQRVKVEFAKKELETSKEIINEIMYEVSYSDQIAFRELFRNITGLSPVQYKEKYNRHRAISLN